MQQRQPRLGDILDDYCPRERRVTNHAVVAMVGSDVRQTRCTTCDAEHDYKHAKVPRQRRKAEPVSALYSHVLAGGPKRVLHEPEAPNTVDGSESAAGEGGTIAGWATDTETIDAAQPDTPPQVANPSSEDEADAERGDAGEEGPVHRPLIRATLPRQEGQPPHQRQGPDFTIRQPGGRPHRFRPRHQQGGQPFHGNRSGGGTGGPMRGGMPRQNNGRPPLTSRAVNRHGSGRKRSK
jgi:hypothetical protein